MRRRPRFFLALYVSKAISYLISLLARGRGTNLPGKIALKIDPKFLAHIQGIEPEKTIFVTGTNGKSTTTNLLYQILREAGMHVIANLDGANMTTGVAVPLLRNCSLLGKVHCDFVLMETDERYVSRIWEQIPAKYLCITNIQKDQVQRNGEPSVILNKLREAVKPEMTIFVNQDEPNCFSLRNAGAARVVSYAVGPIGASHYQGLSFFSVSMPCPVCHNALVFQSCNLSKTGRFFCPACGLGSERAPDYLATDVCLEEHRFSVQGVQYPCHYDAPQFLFSHIAALAIARELGIGEAAIAAAFDGFRGKSDRIQTLEMDGHTFIFSKTKQENSENLQNIVDAVSGEPGDKVFLLGLDEFVGYDPPYIDSCYLFDCDYHALQASGVSKWGCMANYEGYSAALALSYNGMVPNRGSVLAFDNIEHIRSFLADSNGGKVYLVEENPFWQG